MPLEDNNATGDIRYAVTALVVEMAREILCKLPHIYFVHYGYIRDGGRGGGAKECCM